MLKVIYCLILLFIIVGEVIQFYYWWNHDTLTFMQVLKHFFWLNVAETLGVIILWILGTIIKD